MPIRLLTAKTIKGSGISPLNTITIIQVEADFPAPITGEINLLPNVTYMIDGVVTITNTIVPAANNAIIANDAVNNELNYTGVGTMFKGREFGIVIGTVILRCATGTLHDWVDTAPVHTSVVEFNEVNVAECLHAGTATDIKQFRYFACVMNDIKTTGHQFFGDIEQIFAVDTDYVNNSATPVYDLGTVTSDLIWVLDYQVNLVNAGGSWLSGLASSANINAGGLGQLLVGLNLGAGTDLVGITTDDTLWEFGFINRIADSRPDALISFSGNAAETSISGTGVGNEVKVNSNNTWAESRGSRFTTDNTGRITYVGVKDVVVPISASMTAGMAQAGSKQVGFTIALNGTPITASVAANEISAVSPGNTGVVWQLTLSTNDFIEVFTQNNADTVNIIVSSGILRVN
jgi:hypothetical protein